MPRTPPAFADTLRKAMNEAGPALPVPLREQIAMAVGLPTHMLATISVKCRPHTPDEIQATYMVSGDGRRRLAAVLSRYQAVQRMTGAA